MIRHRFFVIHLFFWGPTLMFGQQVVNVPEAFEGLNPEPEVIFISNQIDVPTEGGHLQGVQVLQLDGGEKLLISGSSKTQSYMLQADLTTRKADRLIPLLKDPFRHAGGFQAVDGFVAVGIEDNYTRTTSKVHLYKPVDDQQTWDQSEVTINRSGVPERYTAGATGLLAMDHDHLLVVGNWNSRNWDFYLVDLDEAKQKTTGSFAVPDSWPAYQSINLISDDQAVYAIGFYQRQEVGYADLVLVSRRGDFKLIMEQMMSKKFNCTNGVDFSAAAGLQVDRQGKLHVWATQRDGLEKIAVNRFSELTGKD